MEDTATVIDPGTAEAQSKETESAAPAPEAQAAAPASKPDVKALLKREKDDPYTVFNNAELDVLEAHWDAEEKGKGKAPEPKAKPEAEIEGEKPEKEPTAKPDKKEEVEEETEPEQGEETPEAKALLKEVGAKNLKEAAQKVKDLRALVGGKDAQAVARVTRERDELITTQRAFWSALKAGDPSARAVAEKSFGVKFAEPQGSPVQQQKPVSAGDGFLDTKLFIDPDSANQANAVFMRQEAKIKALEEKFGKVEAERDRHIQATTKEKALGSVVDEMAQIAQYIPELKAIPGFREAAQAVLNGTPDPRFAVVEELFEIAASIKGATLKDAFDIKRGRDSDRRELVAKQQGLKEAYNQTPNPSLSGKAGGKGEGAYQPVTDADLERWSEDFNTHPASWYNKSTGKLDMSKVPKRAHKIFDPA